MQISAVREILRWKICAEIARKSEGFTTFKLLIINNLTVWGGVEFELSVEVYQVIEIKRFMGNISAVELSAKCPSQTLDNREPHGVNSAKFIADRNAYPNIACEKPTRKERIRGLHTHFHLVLSWAARGGDAVCGKLVSEIVGIAERHQ